MVGPSRALSLLIAIACCLSSWAMNVTYDGRAIIIDGQRRVLISGSIHYARSTAEMWPDLIQKAKEGGVDAIDTYIFWNAHEPSRGEVPQNLDFVALPYPLHQDAGLYVVLRIGPYVCAEWNYGGFPVWLHQIPGIELRTNNDIFKYHGGTNFGRTSGGPYLTTSYDYDAPLDEYGNIRQPKWGHLKQLHSAIKMMEKILTYGEVNTTQLGNALAVTKFSINETSSGCFLTNANQSSDANATYNGNTYLVPSRSISILPDCKKEVYNTAKVTTQTSLMVNKPIKSTKLSWKWHSEIMEDTLNGKGSFSNESLLEQIMTTGDASDYLWYMTSVTLNKSSTSWSKKMNLRVKTKGHILHAYVNNRLIGSGYATKGSYKFDFEQEAELRDGHNFITLLSATDGLANYGAFFDLQKAGIDGGPVELIGNGKEKIDLTKNKWSYKTTFEVPDGNDSLVLDLQGMGKGHAWVNGQSIGRYWPSFLAADSGCEPCDYRQKYDSDKCRTECGMPSQRWYHVPRSFTTKGPNTLILFEEVGGDPSQVSLQTVTIGTVCAIVVEGSILDLSCQGSRSFSEIQFASFGNPQGSCGSFKKGSCEAPDALAVVKKACIGRSNCSINVTASAFRPSECSDLSKRFAVQAIC
ncbi:hypothetical protein C4D60_Mb02t22530 [Musa balbisiana]|uniref:beta-galactosidase n=1 Tax=Musa balbisiana TaxID=52838 RepID=A0A4S8ICP6_MUSBA|nr:hypothetical protein C4D60_Mb02t22530 [Musa balbisiana]